MNLISRDGVDVERWRRIESVLDQAFELEPEEVPVYLDRACAGSPQLRREIEALLEADRRADRFMAVPAPMLAASLSSRVEGGRDAPREAPPEQIGRYRVLRELGRGGMGIVYLGRDDALEREVAIKALPAEVADRPERLARFLREARLLGVLHHPNIAAIHGIEPWEGRRYLVLERVEGCTLSERLRGGALPMREALDLCAQIAAALAVAHAQGIAHRDLKPGNVMVTPTGLVKVLDFGLAAHVAEGAPPSGTREPIVEGAAAASAHHLTRAGARLGTPGFMSPEQIRGEPIDTRTDLFAWGAVLFQCLTGTPAFEGDSTDAIVHATLRTPVPMSQLPAPTPDSVRSLLARALERDPAKRLANAGDAAEALEALDGRPARARASGRGARVRRTAMRASRDESGARWPDASGPFVGRVREMAATVALMDRARLVTLTGPGGCGKTRLALEIANAAPDAMAEILAWSDLAPASDETGVAAAIAQAFGVRGAPEALERAVAVRIGGRPSLLVLDGCDRVLAACASLAGPLLAANPTLRILATSREWLGALGEQTLRIPPLSVPEVESRITLADLAANESVRLFVARARNAAPGFGLDDTNAARVAAICRDLDGIPLALELTAALLRRQSLETVAEAIGERVRLGGAADARAQHDALPAALQLSYDRLAADEGRFFRALSAFTGGWTLEAALAVCDEGADEFATLDRLTRLLQKSLVTVQRADRSEPRYRLLEPIRQFAAACCEAESEGAALRGRHLDWFLTLAERSAPSLLSGADQARCLIALEADHANLLAALATCEHADDGARKALRLGGAVWLFWYVRGHFTHGREALRHALHLPGAEAPTPERAQALFAAGGLALYQGDVTEGRRLSGRALELYETLNDELGVARSLSHVAVCAADEGRYAEAHDAYMRALEIFRAEGDPRRLSATLNNLGVLERQYGNPARALPLHEEALALFRGTGDRDGMIVTLLNLAIVSLRLGRAPDDARHVEAALRHVRDLRARRAGASALEVAVEVLHDRGRSDPAARLLGAAAALRSSMALSPPAAWQQMLDEAVNRLRSAMGAERLERQIAEGGGRSFEAAVDDALRELEAEELRYAGMLTRDLAPTVRTTT